VSIQPNRKLKILNYKLQPKTQLSGSVIIAAAVKPQVMPPHATYLVAACDVLKKSADFELKIKKKKEKPCHFGKKIFRLNKSLIFF